jgi:hypothetical protein
MKKKVFLFTVILFSCSNLIYCQTGEKDKINAIMDAWHKSAAIADSASYFDAMTKDAIFIGTDSSEIWNKTQFLDYSSPHFKRGKAWSFTSYFRNVYFSEDKKTAWFDEVLKTRFGPCRGSGVLVKVKSKWMIKHYVLSAAVPNDKMDAYINLLKS